MVTGGNATVFITDMDAAIKFYTEVLGMELTAHYGNDWATVSVGGFTIGLHPRNADYPDPGTHGSIHIGLVIDRSIESARNTLVAAGTKNIGEIKRGSGGSFLYFTDPDGNRLYLWEM